jgi:hypothetical protein
MSKRVAKMRHNPLGVDIAADRQPFDGNKGVRRKDRGIDPLCACLWCLVYVCE